MRSMKGTTMEQVVWRPADITPEEAQQGLLFAYPNAKVASFGIVKKGGKLLYEAKLVSAEFPPAAKDDGDGDEGGSPDGPPSPFSDESTDGPDDSGDGEEKPKKEKKEKGGDKAEHQILDILTQMAQAMGIPVAPPEGEGDEGPPVPPGADAGDGADVPPPPPVAEDAPLPPPAAPKGGGGGGGGLGMPFSSVDKFAGDQHVAALRQSVANRRSFSMAFEDGNAPTLMVANTMRDMFPEFEIKRIEKRQGILDGGEPQDMHVFAMLRR